MLAVLVAAIIGVYAYDSKKRSSSSPPRPSVDVVVVGARPPRRLHTRWFGKKHKAAAVAAAESFFSPPPLLPSTPTTQQAVVPVPVISLFWDNDEGAYMMRVRMGKGDVEAVVDTGSSNISAKGSDCTWTNCGENGNGDACVTQACPCGVDRRDGTPRENCDDFYYRPRGSYVKPGHDGAGSKTTLVYGSQKDKVAHFMEEVSLPCMAASDVSCATLLQGDDHVPPEENNEYLLGKMIVHLVHHITGTSSSNLFGLARPEAAATSKNQRRRGRDGSVRHENGAYVVVQKLFRASSSSSPTAAVGVWSLLLHKKTGWLALGSLEPCARPVAYVPMVDPAAFSFFVTHFYVIEVVSLEVGLRPDTLQTVKRPPKYCLLDTGTTYTYASPELGAQMQQDFGYTELGWCMRLTLGSRGGERGGERGSERVVLNYAATDLVDEAFPESSVFQCLPGKTLADFDAIFTSRDVLLFGALMMRNAYWEFDMEKKRVGCSQLG